MRNSGNSIIVEDEIPFSSFFQRRDYIPQIEQYQFHRYKAVAVLYSKNIIAPTLDYTSTDSSS